jgi:hypothetical protein
VDTIGLIAAVVNDEWRPGIGDPTFMGWFTVAAYLAASIACAWAARMEIALARSGSRAAAAFWWLFAGLLVLLGVNKQLDLQSLVTVVGRRVALAQGWYEHRRIYQAIFIGGVALLGIAVLGAFGWYARGVLRRSKLAVAGAAFLVTFVIVRASSFHQVDRLLGLRLGGLKWNWILELSGIVCVGIAAVRRAYTVRQALRRGW